MIAPGKNREHFFVKVQRQDGPSQPPYWETFKVDYRPNMNVISALQKVATTPVTTEGKEVEPITWDACCLEEVCGACTMVINGHVRQSCSTLVDEILDETGTFTLTPMTKYPVVRDLFVDRSRMFETLKKVKAWVPIDGLHSLGAGPEESPESQQDRYKYSRCMTCGCCTEACPQFTPDNDFVGPAAIGQSYYFNEHETGKRLKEDRLRTLMGPGGITDCGNAQNCAKVCPKEIPLTEAIAKIGRQVTIQAMKDFFAGK